MGTFINIFSIMLVVSVVTEATEMQSSGNFDSESEFAANSKGSRDLPCPDPELIFPCECKVGSENTMDMDCSNVTSNDQLKQIFSAEFPFRNFRTLKMYANQHLKTLRENDLGEVTFEELAITFSALEVIEPNALTESLATLKTLFLLNNQLKSFPFEEIPIYTKLDSLFLEGNAFSNYPTLISPTLTSVTLSYNNFTELPHSALDYLPNIEFFDFTGNAGIDILPGTFTRSSQLHTLKLAHCELKYIPAGAVQLNTTESMLILAYNDISNVEVNAIRGVTDTMHLYGNAITELKEEVWQPVIDGVRVFNIVGNPLLCGCDIAWLIINPSYMEKLPEEVACSSGELLTELDPSIYDLLC